MIDIVNLTQHYGVRPILKNLNLRVATGELVAVMGPNGMGKSTLLATVAGMLAPQEGYVEIDGLRRRSSEVAELKIRQRVFYLPDNPWLPVYKTGREFLLNVGRLYGVAYNRLFDHIERLAPLFDLTHQIDAPIKSYSTGQQKKISICSALVSDVPILLLDEPFSGGLDPSALFALKRVMQGLAARNDITALITTPVPEIVEEVAERIAILRDGNVLAYDTADGLRAATGVSGSLQDVLETMLSPDTLKNIEKYFEGSRS
ncbi:MAG: ABC transporter ATP-binding protein [Candidatus Hydrogenedentes bacterium]|nr:ABC transporter ATP-binding protein [Candidatus Hydrogenedentota bacterium]